MAKEEKRTGLRVGRTANRYKSERCNMSKIPESIAAPIPAQQSPEPRGTNEYGLDVGYIAGKLNLFLRDIDRYTPSEAARVLARLAKVSDEKVLAESEFSQQSPVTPTDERTNEFGEPETIYLQLHDPDDGNEKSHGSNYKADGVTWCWHPINENDVRYIRADLFQQSPAVAVPDQPKLTVWYGSMPESNGRENWTAILHNADDEGFDIFTDGHTIDRSEYPERVKYAADRVRWLIGELPEKTFILDYDANKRSSYESESSPRITEQDAREISASEVYLFRRKGLEPFLTCSRERFDELSENDSFETKILYENSLVSAPFPHPRISEDELKLIAKKYYDWCNSEVVFNRRTMLETWVDEEGRALLNKLNGKIEINAPQSN